MCHSVERLAQTCASWMGSDMRAAASGYGLAAVSVSVGGMCWRMGVCMHQLQRIHHCNNISEGRC